MTRCMMLPFRQTCVQSVVCLDEMDNCGTGGWDFHTELTKGAVDGTVQRTVPVIGSLSKEDSRISKSRHKLVKLAVAINFVLGASERLDYKFNVLTRVDNFNSCFSSFFNSTGDQTFGPLPAQYVLCNGYLTLILLTWRKWWTPNNASKWQMGFNSAFKGLILSTCRRWYKCAQLRYKLCIINP